MYAYEGFPGEPEGAIDVDAMIVAVVDRPDEGPPVLFAGGCQARRQDSPEYE